MITPEIRLQQVLEIGRRADLLEEQRQQLRSELLSDLFDPEVDTESLKGRVTVQKVRSKIDDPRIVGLRMDLDRAIAELAQVNAELIYAAQHRIQAAQEELAALLSNDVIEQMAAQLALLEADYLLNSPHLCSTIVIKN